MSLVASVDYPNQRIYLGIDSVNIRLDTLDVFREVRTLRATTEDHRRFPPIIASGGNVQKTEDTATAKFVKLTAGTMIVPYDGDHTITLIRDTFTEDNLSGTDVFDLTLLSPSTSVQIKEDIPQVEVVTVSTGSGLDDQQSADLIAIKALSDKLDAMIEDVSGNRFTSKALEQGPSGSGGSTAYTATTFTRVDGDNEGGGLVEIQSLDEQYAITGETATGLDVLCTVGSSTTSDKPSLIRINGFYSSSNPSHEVDILVWNYTTSSWDERGAMASRSSSYEYVIALNTNHHHPATGEMQVRFLHNVVSYNTSHSLNLDYISFEKANTSLASDIATILNNQQQLLEENKITSDFIVSSTSNTATLANSASFVDGAYDPAVIKITSGTGAGQSRIILQYTGSSKVAVLNRDWKVQPDTSSKYVIEKYVSSDSVNEGLIRAATANTAQLNIDASSVDDIYIGQFIFIVSGTGVGQTALIKDYDGTTQTAIISGSWVVTPDTTSAYIMKPASPVLLGQLNHIGANVQGVLNPVINA